MKSFKLDQYGDVVITNNQIELVEDVELIAQTVRQVLNTNLREWFDDEQEGIDRSVILTKNPNYDLIRDTINTGVMQVADGMGVDIDTSNFEFIVNGRNLAITFTLTLNSAESTEISMEL